MSQYLPRIRSVFSAGGGSNPYYRCNEPSGNLVCTGIVADTFVANGAPLYSVPGPIPDLFGVGFSGNAADFFEVPSSGANNVADNVAICAIVKTVAAATQTIMSRATTGYSVGMDATGHIILVKVGTATIVTSTTTINDGAWHHIVVRKNGGASCQIIIDGADVSGVVTNQTLVATGGPHDLGRELQTTNQPWNGAICEVVIGAGSGITAANALSAYQAYQASINQISESGVKGSRSENMYPNGNGRSRFQSGASEGN